MTHDLRAEAPATDARQPARYALRLLGGFGLERDGRAVAVPQGARRLLAYLGVRQRCARSEAAGTLWPGSHEERARANLRTMLWRLHRVTPSLWWRRTTCWPWPPGSPATWPPWARRPPPCWPAGHRSASAPACRRWRPASCCPAGTTTGCWPSGSGCARRSCTRWRRCPSDSPRRAGLARRCRWR
ncbi:hypothetical protein NKG94_11000 [Micromonospora sp. M12]